MPSLPPPAPVRLGDVFADAMGRVAGCPSGRCINTEPPRAAVPTAIGWMTSHLCADCGHAWTMEWS